jgi:hypothetical protein
VNEYVLDNHAIDGAISLLIEDRPRAAVITCRIAGGDESLRLVNPQPLEPLVSVFEMMEPGLSGIRIIDLNIRDKSQLEFGRFNVELWDEDGEVGTVIADAFEVMNAG